MVFRVTNQGQQQAALNNVFRISEDLFKVQNELSSGKRIQRPSDDPSGTRQTLSLRTDLDKTKQFIRNIENMQRFTSGVDSALEDISLSLIRARELTVNQISATSTAETRRFSAKEVENLIAQVISSANFKVGNRHVFGGDIVDSAPLTQSASGAVYTGNTESITTDIDINSPLQVNIPGSEILATDLNPALSLDTALSDLNRGSGVSASSFVITDRAGTTGTVLVSSGETMETVINSINSLGTKVTASINSEQNGINLTDNSTLITGALKVAEVGTGTAAEDLGILGSRNGDFSGLDLDPRLSYSTTLSQLNGGSGITLSDIKIINGTASGTISFSSLNSHTTLGDFNNVINNSGLNVVADIGSGGNDLKVVSADSTTVAVVQDVGVGTTAETLGLGGGRNIITTLVKLKTALESSDRVGLLSSLENIDSGLETIGSARAQMGAIGRRLQSNENSHDQNVVNQSQRLARVEEIDFAQKASELAALELAFQATLNSTARILQPSILDFLS